MPEALEIERSNMLPNPINVFVHLAYGFGEERWSERWDLGLLKGFNERSPYGYRHAEALNCKIRYSVDCNEGLLGKFTRGLGRVALGFDFVHAWRNREAILAADVVWTHTESQSLAVAFLLRLYGVKSSPRLIAQTIWLMDEWRRTPGIKKWLYRILLSRADVLTFHSEINAKMAREVFPGHDVRVVHFGISKEYVRAVPEFRREGPIRVLSAGNDRHRDWPILIAAVANDERFELEVLTKARIDTGGAGNIRVSTPSDNKALLAAFDSADIVVVPLKSNMHASGITVVLEAITRGIPVICSQEGGIDGYFSNLELRFISENSSAEILIALGEFYNKPEVFLARAKAAQAKVLSSGPNSFTFAKRHADISAELIHGRDDGN